MRILIAEDEKIAAQILIKALESLGHEVVHAKDGPEAWERLQAEPFPVVISDWIMPGFEGPELCRRVRSLRDRAYCYVLMLTSLDHKERRLEALGAGADDFLIKPLDKDELRARLVVASRILAMQENLGEKCRELEEISYIAEMARNRFSQLFDGLPIACFTCDSNCMVFEWNRRAEEVFGFNPAEAIGRPIWDLMGAALVGERGREALARVFGGEAFQSAEWSDDQRTFLVSAMPHCGRGDQITGAILSAVDVTAQKRAEEMIGRQLVELNEAHQELSKLTSRLAALATTDAVTGIANHRAFHVRLAQMMKSAQQGPGFALAMIDVDKFKLFNDEFGHQAGDQVLQAVAQTLKGHVREVDFVARYGGEEFAILFSDADSVQGARFCEDLRRQVERIQTRYRPVTASFGVAAFRPDTSGPEAIIRMSDTALYRAKMGGRNRVVIWTPDTSTMPKP